jgi:hypothetical protein
MLASVDASVAARCAFATVCVRVDGHYHAWLESFGHVGSYGFDYCTNFVARDYGHLHHRVLAEVGVEVGTAESYVFHSEKHFARCWRLRFLHFDDLHAGRFVYLYSFHDA